MSGTRSGEILGLYEEPHPLRVTVMPLQSCGRLAALFLQEQLLVFTGLAVNSRSTRYLGDALTQTKHTSSISGC